MTKSCLGVSLDLESNSLTTLVVDPAGNHQLSEEKWLTGKPPDSIREGLSKNKAELVLGLPEKAVRTRYLELPALKPAALETAVRSTVMRYFPFQASRHTLTQVPCPTLSGDRKRKGVVTFVINQSLLRSHVDWIQERGGKVNHIEFPSLALVRWICWERPDLRKGPFLWLHLGASQLQLGLVVDRLYYGCITLTPPLLRLPVWADLTASLEGWGPYVDYFASEVVGAATYFCHRLSPAPLEPKSLVLTGHHQSDETLQRVLSSQLPVPLLELSPDRLKLESRFGALAGLSLRNLEVP